MRVTSAGQVSVPAEVRRRWATTRVRITDEGDRLIVEPEAENPFADLIGILAEVVDPEAENPFADLIGILAEVVDRQAYDELTAADRAVELERDRRRYPWAAEEDR